MKKTKAIITMTGVFVLLFSYGNMLGNIDHPGLSVSDQTTSKTTQTKTKSTQTGSKTTQAKTKSAQTGSKSAQTKSKSSKTVSKTAPVKPKTIKTDAKLEPEKKKKIPGTVTIGTQTWAVANLNVSTFRNGDSIPEARTNQEWIAAGDAGKPAWCYYNNDPAIGLKFGKLYNWYAVNDPRELAPDGWALSNDEDWSQLAYALSGSGAAGYKMKSTKGWIDGNNGSDEAGFTGLAGGYRLENGKFVNSGSIGIWWSTTESNSREAIDHYLSQGNNIASSSSPRQRGESVRCILK